MNRKKLNIGAYILQPYARTEEHIRGIRECGIDFITMMDDDRAALDLFEKYGIGAVVKDVAPFWSGGFGENAGQLEATNPPEVYEKIAASFVDHPAIWGIDVGDEPSAKDFPYYGKVIADVNRLFPKQFAFLNLYPNYASVSQNTAEETVNQLGTATYDEHIAEYCKYVPTDYICYDFYVYSVNVPKMYENLRCVADACLRTGRSLWIVIQVNSNRAEKWITENELRYQAYNAMAFGAENIIWACYTAGWWENQVLDGNGNKTEQYAKLQKVNAELHRIGEEYMRYRRTSTHLVGFDGTEWLDGVKQKSISSLDNGFFFGVKEENGSPIVVGEMTEREGNGHALFVCDASDPYDEKAGKRTVVFRTLSDAVRVCNGKGNLPLIRREDGSFSVTFDACDAVLIEGI